MLMNSAHVAGIAQQCSERMEAFFLSADGYLMPIKKDQAPPDLRYFNQPKK
jgi:hypothetical protein